MKILSNVFKTVGVICIIVSLVLFGLSFAMPLKFTATLVAALFAVGLAFLYIGLFRYIFGYHDKNAFAWISLVLCFVTGFAGGFLVITGLGRLFVPSFVAWFLPNCEAGILVTVGVVLGLVATFFEILAQWQDSLVEEK